MTVLFTPNQVMFNNVNTTNVVMNTNNDKRTTPAFYTIAKIIAILKTITHTSFSISIMALSYGYIWIPSSYSIHFTNATNIREILGLEGRTVILPAPFYGLNVIAITRNHQVNQMYSSLVGSFDMKIANQNNYLLTTIIIDDPTINSCRSVVDICIPMITRFDRLMIVFEDLVARIMQLNGEFELLLTINDRVETDEGEVRHNME